MSAQGVQSKIQNPKSAIRRQVVGDAFVVSSPSGGGKTTVVDRLLRRMRRLERSVSMTTRTPRRGERNGREYHFVDRTTFERLRRRGELLEWARVHGAAYGTPKRAVLGTMRRGRDVILNIDVQGARQVRRRLGQRAVLVFLVPPSMAALRERLAARQTESAAQVRRRLTAARRELACARSYDYRVVNDRLPDTVATLAAIIAARRRVRSLDRRRGV